jgi:hypothetical protein
VPIGGYVQPVFSVDCVFTELGRFKPRSECNADPDLLQKWEASIEEVVRKYREAAEERGIKPLKTDLTSFDQFLNVLQSTCTDGTAGLWAKKYPAVMPFEDTKRGVYLTALKKFQSNPDDEQSSGFFVDLYQTVLQYNRAILEDPSAAFVHSFAKDEPMKVTKLEQGKARSIQIPDWSIVVWEQWHSCFEAPDGQIMTWDDVVGQLMLDEAFVKDQDVLNSVGIDTMITVKRIAQRCKEQGITEVVAADVEQWDRNVHYRAFRAVHRAMNHGSSGEDHERRVLNHADGLNGMGTYEVGGQCFQFKMPVSAWCSGALKTLVGNTFMHEALLRIAGAKGAVMGDDLLALIRWLELQKVVNGVGLRWKDGCVPSPHAEYCAINLDLRTGETSRDWVKIICKRAARHNNVSDFVDVVKMMRDAEKVAQGTVAGSE